MNMHLKEGFTKWHLAISMTISKSPNTTAVTLRNIFGLCVYILCMYVYIYVHTFSMVPLQHGHFFTQILTKDIP